MPFPFTPTGYESLFAPQQDAGDKRLDFLSNALISLGAGITHAGSQGRPFWDGIAPGAAMFAKSQGEQRQQDEAKALRDFQLGLHLRALTDKEDERKRQLAANDAYARSLNPGSAPPTMRAPQAPVMGPGDYGPKVAADESGGNYTITNAKGSGAYGKYQFMPDTWADVAKKHPELGLPFDMRAATPEHQEAAMKALTADNAGGLRTAGFAPTPDNLYLAHRFGVNGAGTMLRADPNDPVTSLYPAQWTAQNPDMQGKTAGQFRQGVQQRYGGAPVDTPAPVLADVPRPVAPPEFLARQAALVRAGAITPKESEAEINKLVTDEWAARREAARAKHQQESENWRFNRGQSFEKEKFQRGLETEGEWVRGADGIERFVPKAQRSAGMTRTDKQPDPGTVTGDIATLNKGLTDPAFAATAEYAAAHARASMHLIDGPNGMKYAPDMSKSPYPEPTYRRPGTPPPAPSPMPTATPPVVPGGAPAGMTPIGERNYTESQNKDHTYAARLANAIPQLEALVKGDDGKYSTTKLPSATQRGMADSNFVPDSLVSNDAKQFRQIVKDILTATLRRESGASIASSEFVSENAKFIPQAGDDEKTIRQKLAALKIAARTIAEATGRPLQTYGSAFDVTPDAPKAPIRIDMSGKRQ